MSDALSAVAKGKYYWELVFSYDNSQNTGTLVDRTTITRKKTVNYRDFLSEKFSITSGFKFENQSSVSLKFDGIGQGSDTTSYGFHIDLANELVSTSETAQVIDEQSETIREFQIGPKGKLELYRLCYITDGAALKTDIVSTSPKDQIVVSLKFSCTNHILGLSDILAQFSHTFPGKANKVEWGHIRDSIVQNSDRPEEERFRSFVQNLSTITPGVDNKLEWAAIRDTCGQILGEWDSVPKQVLFRKLLERFSVTVPQVENKIEWSAIRSISDRILGALRQTY